jgi:hypothetical protein
MRTLLSTIRALLTLPAFGADLEVPQPARSNAAICFSLLIVAWYGVNFVLGAGLHSSRVRRWWPGFQGGGRGYAISLRDKRG